MDKGIAQRSVLEAMLNVPRHLFVDKAFDNWAYKDVAFPIDAEQTISQPSTVALQTSLLDLEKGDVVLEIGTGSGYQAAVLSEFGVKVYSIERQKKLFYKTDKLLRKLGYTNVRTLYGDGYKGAPRFAPFDKIIVTAGADHLPKELFRQLKVGGIMVIPLGNGDVKDMIKIIKKSKDTFKKEHHGSCSFVPFLTGVEH